MGEGFGEKALLAKKPEDARRAATIIAESESLDLVVVKRLDFQYVLDEMVNDLKRKKDIIMRTFPKFQYILSNFMIDQLCFYFKDNIVNKN